MDVLEAIGRRRSINFFDPERDLPEEKLKGLLEAANLSPSSFNVQPWKVVVVRDPARKKALRECANNQPKVEEAPVVLILVAEPDFLDGNFERVLDSWVELGYMEDGMREGRRALARSLYGESPADPRRTLTAVKNTALFAMTLMLAAEDMGIETHPMDGINEACIKREFGIPQDRSIPMLVALGYLRPNVTIKPRAFRRKLEEFVSYDKY